MKNKLNLLWVIPVGIAFFLTVEILVFLPIFILGLLLLPFLLWFGTIITDDKKLLHFKNSVIDELFGNFEGGLCPSWWSAEHPDLNFRYAAYLWFVLNPVSNMRRWPIVSTVPKKTVQWVGNVKDIPVKGKPGWFLAWQGPYVGFLWQSRKRAIWVGWKVNPRDANPNAPKDRRYKGLGVDLQYKS